MSIIKKYIQTSLSLATILIVTAGATPHMSLSQPAVSPAPLNLTENDGEGTLNYFMLEQNSEQVSGDNRFRTVVHMSKLKLKNADAKLVSIIDVQNSNEEVSAKFDIKYLPNVEAIVIEQKEAEALPADMRYKVIIPVVVTQDSTASDPANGFLVNMSSYGNAVADGEVSQYTYTKEEI